MSMSVGDLFEEPQLRRRRIELESTRDASVRFAIEMTGMPGAKTRFIGPVGEKPEFVAIVERGEDFHAKEAGSAVDEMRPPDEGIAHLASHVVGHAEPADCEELGGCHGAELYR